MSHSKLEISVSERLILDYIGFRTKSGFPFFEKNSTIAPNVGLTEGTTKELINRLVRKGYLFRCKDERNRRQLLLTELKHPQTYTNFQDISKASLKEELDYRNKELKDTEKQLNDKDEAINVWRNNCYKAEKKVEILEQQVAELQRQLNALQGTPTPQNDNTITIEKEYTDNSESVVNVGSMDNVGNEGNTSNITDDNVVPTDNPNTMDARVIVDNLMRKLCPERYESTN
jgi:DNA-binding MarR family transcriptional regulator